MQLNPNITPEFIILITIIFLLLLYIFRQYKVIADLKHDVKFKNFSNKRKIDFLADKSLGSEYLKWVDTYNNKNRIKETTLSE